MARPSVLSIILYLIIISFSSCSNKTNKGDEYFALASDAVNNDSIIRAYSYTEKAIEEFRKTENPPKRQKAEIFLSLLYFSTGQKDLAYDIIKHIHTTTTNANDYPLFSNYFRIKAFYKSLYEGNTLEALSLIDSVLQLDKVYAEGNTQILNIDRLNKCEILLNGADTTNVKALIDSVAHSTTLPSAIESQFYANKARWCQTANLPDSAYKYAKLVVDKTSKMHEDIDNCLYALDIILHFDSVRNNLSEYIRYRDLMESLKDDRQGERISYGMAFVKEQNVNEKLRLHAETERLTLLLLVVSISLVALTVSLFLIHKHKEALSRNEITLLECDRLDAEAFRRKLENELLTRKINAKSDELVKANNEILELSKQLAQKNTSCDHSEDSYLRRLLDVSECTFPDFQKCLAQLYPAITKAESNLACLIKLNLSSDVIATAMSISKSGLIKARYRLRKRLGVDSSAELDNFISKL